MGRRVAPGTRGEKALGCTRGRGRCAFRAHRPRPRVQQRAALVRSATSHEPHEPHFNVRYGLQLFRRCFQEGLAFGFLGGDGYDDGGDGKGSCQYDEDGGETRLLAK